MKNLCMDAFDEFGNCWALAAAGDLSDHNAMTIAWGGVGCLWGKQVVTVYIRPNRHTYGYFEKNGCFTVSFYPEGCKKALGIMGSKSGRDCDKETLAGLTAVKCGESVTYREARRTILCRKLYAQDMDPEGFPDAVRERFYKTEPAHRMYIGEVVDIIE